MAIDGGLTAR